jgi:hypothetical protein
MQLTGQVHPITGSGVIELARWVGAVTRHRNGSCGLTQRFKRITAVPECTANSSATARARDVARPTKNVSGSASE